MRLVRSRIAAGAILLIAAALVACGTATVPPSDSAGADREDVTAAETTPGDDVPLDESPGDDVVSSDVPGDRVVAMDTVIVDAVDVRSMDAPPADTTAGAYPPGPYGIMEGQVLANLDWVGYVNTAGTAISTTLPFGPTSLQALRGSGRGFGIVHVSEFI